MQKSCWMKISTGATFGLSTYVGKETLGHYFTYLIRLQFFHSINILKIDFGRKLMLILDLIKTTLKNF